MKYEQWKKLWIAKREAIQGSLEFQGYKLRIISSYK